MKASADHILPNDSSANKLVTFLLEKGLGGAGPLSSAENLASEYLIGQGYVDNDERVDSLVIGRPQRTLRPDS